MSSDRALFEHIQAGIRSGAKVIEVPGWMVAGASEATLAEMRQLCQLSGVRLVIRA